MKDKSEGVEELINGSDNLAMMGDFNGKEEWTSEGGKRSWGTTLLKMAMDNTDTMDQGKHKISREWQTIKVGSNIYILGRSDQVVIEFTMKDRREAHRIWRYNIIIERQILRKWESTLKKWTGVISTECNGFVVKNGGYNRRAVRVGRGWSTRISWVRRKLIFKSVR